MSQFALSKDTVDKMKEHVLEIGFGWGVLYRDDEIARDQKATDAVQNIINLFVDEITNKK